MPVFNADEYVEEAISSVREQTLTDWELVAVDDGSDDKSRAILERLAGKDARIRVLTGEVNEGIAAALNKGWRAARSEYIARLDADDVALPERLSQQVAFLDANVSVVAVGGAAIRIDANGRELATVAYPTDSSTIRATLLRQNCLAHPSVTLRRSALEEVGGYRFDHIEDYDLWLRLSERHDLANLPDPMILYRLHAKQVSVRVLAEQTRRGLIVRAAAHERLRGRDDPLEDRTELNQELAERLKIGPRLYTTAVASSLFAWSETLSEIGAKDEARGLLDQAYAFLGARSKRAGGAARHLRLAATSRESGRPIACAIHVVAALGGAPRYSGARLLDWAMTRERRLQLKGRS